VGRLDPWLQPWRDLTAGMAKPVRDVLWSLTPAAVAAGVVLVAVASARIGLGGGGDGTAYHRAASPSSPEVP
jgi:hypothetical protein